ncbi:MAG TPA: hypothetical protein VJ697_06280 [Nitrososphaeraceae archaeon]|nr:hypothetical protein [Nitrososphaeraceae archaeon]
MVVKRTNSWHNRFRKLFTRYEKKDKNYLGLVQLANSIIVYRRLILGYALKLFALVYLFDFYLANKIMIKDKQRFTKFFPLSGPYLSFTY